MKTWKVTLATERGPKTLTWFKAEHTNAACIVDSLAKTYGKENLIITSINDEGDIERFALTYAGLDGERASLYVYSVTNKIADDDELAAVSAQTYCRNHIKGGAWRRGAKRGSGSFRTEIL
jgi:hypothetical protein